MTEQDIYTGRIRRLCNECGVEVERPTRVLGKESSRAWRSAYRKEIQRQILWEATCPCCRRWWNEVLRRIQDGPSAPPTTESTVEQSSEKASPNAANPSARWTSQ